MSDKCIRCGVTSDELRCYDCYKKRRQWYIPSKLMEVQQRYIIENQEKQYHLVKEKFQDLVNVNAIERISIHQKKYCEVKDELCESEELVERIGIQIDEIAKTNELKKKRIILLRQQLEKSKQEEQKASEELDKRESILLNIKKRKVEMAYNLRVINHTYPNWSINSELEKQEIPFQNKKNNKVEKSFQNYILLKKKQEFLTQVQSQQLLFSINQIALFIYYLHSIFQISSHFPLVRKTRNQIVFSGEGIRLFDDNLRTIFHENLIYLYLNYKLILQRFNIHTTRNPYFFFDISYFKERFLSRKNRRDCGEVSKITTYNGITISCGANFTDLLPCSVQEFEDSPPLQQSHDYFRSKQDSLFINLESTKNIGGDCDENTQIKYIEKGQTSKTPQRSMQHHLIHSDQQLAATHQNFRVRSLTQLEEAKQLASSSPINQLQRQQNNMIAADNGRTYRLLFVKSPLIKIEYKDNLKQKEFSFNDPYIYAPEKVTQSGWEIYDDD